MSEMRFSPYAAPPKGPKCCKCGATHTNLQATLADPTLLSCTSGCMPEWERSLVQLENEAAVIIRRLYRWVSDESILDEIDALDNINSELCTAIREAHSA